MGTKRTTTSPTGAYEILPQLLSRPSPGGEQNLTNRGGCLRGTHLVTVGMELLVLLIPTAKHALIIKKATVRWADEAHFGVELNEADCGTVAELDDVKIHRQQALISFMTH